MQLLTIIMMIKIIIIHQQITVAPVTTRITTIATRDTMEFVSTNNTSEKNRLTFLSDHVKN